MRKPQLSGLITAMMKKNTTSLPDVYEIEPNVISDERGHFIEAWSKKALEEIGIKIDFVEMNERFIKEQGTIRGLHFQNMPQSQAKLIRVTSGKIYDVAVDLRHGSPTYMNWTGVELSAENHKMLYIPHGFAHGYLTLTDNTIISYTVDAPYTPALERVVKYNDPSISVDWGIDAPILSQRDMGALNFSECDCNFVYREEQ